MAHVPWLLTPLNIIISVAYYPLGLADLHERTKKQVRDVFNTSSVHLFFVLVCCCWSNETKTSSYSTLPTLHSLSHSLSPVVVRHPFALYVKLENQKKKKKERVPRRVVYVFSRCYISFCWGQEGVLPGQKTTTYTKIQKKKESLLFVLSFWSVLNFE